MNRTTTALTAALLLTTLAACGQAGHGVTDAKVTASPAVTIEADEPTVETTPTETEEDGIFTLTETATYEDGRKIRLSNFTRTTSHPDAAPGSTPYARFTVEIDNNSTEHIDLTDVLIDCLYGETVQGGEMIFDSSDNPKTSLEGVPSGKLLAGKTITFPIGCELPKDETYLQIEVTPDFDSETSIFSGAVK